MTKGFSSLGFLGVENNLLIDDETAVAKFVSSEKSSGELQTPLLAVQSGIFLEIQQYGFGPEL